MKQIKVKDLMIPLSEYATVSQDATLYEAVLALEKAQTEYLTEIKPHSYPHRAILVLDKKGDVIGKISQLDVIKSLEPKYQDIISSDSMARLATSGFSSDFLKNMMKSYGLYDKPLQDICKKAFEIKAKNCMYTPGEGEYVQEEDTLEVAVHQFVVGHHQSLLVTKNKKIIGILRLVDVFKEVCSAMKACESS